MTSITESKNRDTNKYQNYNFEGGIKNIKLKDHWGEY